MSRIGTNQFDCVLHIAIIHFDQIIGPHLIQIFPEIETERGKRISKVLQQLIDVGSLHDRREFEFVYSDRYFSSLNVYLTILNSNARGGQEDFMISAMIMPTYSQVVSSMVMDWNSLYELKMNCLDLLGQGVINKIHLIFTVYYLFQPKLGMSRIGTNQFDCVLHIAIIHFDQIIGPHLIQIFPEIETERGKRISKVLQQLIDVGSLHDRREFEFVYSDRYFSSLNVYLTILNSNARGGQEDFMISAMIMPTYSQVVSSMVMDWNSLYELKMNCLDLLGQGVINKIHLIFTVYYLFQPKLGMSRIGTNQFDCVLHIAIIHFDQIIGPHLIQIFPEIETERGK
ncbi:MAG: hypothetical protein HeimC2_35250, partial [Candidatus Heimdallarchaeota archaeon LC_2]